MQGPIGLDGPKGEKGEPGEKGQRGQAGSAGIDVMQAVKVSFRHQFLLNNK